MYVNELVKPVLACFRDQDSRVRYYSCEALYNIVKVTRGSMLPFFNEIFDALSKVCMYLFSIVEKKLEKIPIVFSSPEHEVLMVSYCDQSLSVVRALSTYCFKRLLLQNI